MDIRLIAFDLDGPFLADNKNIPYYKRGNRRFFDRDEIDDWLREQRIDTNNEVIAKAVGYRR